MPQVPHGPNGSGPSLYEQPVLVVSQKTKLIELTNEYAVFDGQGQQIGAVVQVGQSGLKKAVRFVSNFDQFLTHRLEVRDARGPVLVLTRPAKFVKSRVVVERPDGAPVGEIVQANVFGKIRFDLVANGQLVGAIQAENWRAWDFAIIDAAGTEIARITKKWEGLARTTVHHGRPLRRPRALPAARAAGQHGDRLRADRRHRAQAGRPRLQLAMTLRSSGSLDDMARDPSGPHDDIAVLRIAPRPGAVPGLRGAHLSRLRGPSGPTRHDRTTHRLARRVNAVRAGCIVPPGAIWLRLHGLPPRPRSGAWSRVVHLAARRPSSGPDPNLPTCPVPASGARLPSSKCRVTARRPAGADHRQAAVSAGRRVRATVEEAHKLPVKTLVSASIGNAVEWFDWTVYATFVVFFAGQFFPPRTRRSR